MESNRIMVAIGIVGMMGLAALIAVNASNQIWERREQQSALTSSTVKDEIVIWHDDARNVTCWIVREKGIDIYGGSLSCLPDNTIQEKKAP